MMNSGSGTAFAVSRGEHGPPRPPEPRTDLASADRRIVLAATLLTVAATLVTGVPILTGSWPVSVVAVAAMGIGAVAGRTLCRRWESHCLAQRQGGYIALVIPATPGVGRSQ
jgi:hypothetical protein